MQRVGMTFYGGPAQSAFELGVARAAFELDVRPIAFVGAGIGALTAAVLATTPEPLVALSRLEQMWVGLADVGLWRRIDLQAEDGRLHALIAEALDNPDAPSHASCRIWAPGDTKATDLAQLTGAARVAALARCLAEPLALSARVIDHDWGADLAGGWRTPDVATLAAANCEFAIVASFEDGSAPVKAPTDRCQVIEVRHGTWGAEGETELTALTNLGHERLPEWTRQGRADGLHTLGRVLAAEGRWLDDVKARAELGAAFEAFDDEPFTLADEFDRSHPVRHEKRPEHRHAEAMPPEPPRPPATPVPSPRSEGSARAEDSRDKETIRDEEVLRDDRWLTSWIESVPFPVATILQRYRTERDVHRRTGHLVDFFEALAILYVSIMLGAFHQDPAEFAVMREKLRNRNDANLKGFKRGAFGMWEHYRRVLTKRIRAMMAGAEGDRCLAMFGLKSRTFVEALADPRWEALFEVAVEVRNERSHLGSSTVATEATRLERLENVLFEVAPLIEGRMKQVVLVFPQVARRRGTTFEQDVLLVRGADPVLMTATFTVAQAIEDGRLCLVEKGNLNCRPCPIAPLVHLEQDAETQHHACYFFNRLEDEASGCWVRYQGGPARTKADVHLDAFYRDLLTNASA